MHSIYKTKCLRPFRPRAGDDDDDDDEDGGRGRFLRLCSDEYVFVRRRGNARRLATEVLLLLFPWKSRERIIVAGSIYTLYRVAVDGNISSSSRALYDNVYVYNRRTKIFARRQSREKIAISWGVISVGGVRARLRVCTAYGVAVKVHIQNGCAPEDSRSAV